MPSIISSLATNFMRVDYTTKSLSNGYKSASATTTLANELGCSEKACRGSLFVFPEGHDTEYTAVTKAIGEITRFYKDKTVPIYSPGKTKEGRTGQKGARLVASKELVDGFEPTIAQMVAEMKQKREHLARNRDAILSSIINDPAVNKTYNPDKFPTADEIRAGFDWVLMGPDLLADSQQLTGMALTPELVEAYEQRMNQDAQQRAAVAQQVMAEELAEYLKALATTTSKLFEHHNTPESQRGRAPRVAATLTTNVHDMVEKIRTYAIPETPQGAALLALADTVLERLEVDIRDADDIRENPGMAANMARDAAEIISAIEALDTDFVPTF